MTAVPPTSIHRRDRVLLVVGAEPEALRIQALARGAALPPFEWSLAFSLASALERLKAGGVDVVLAELCLPDSAGLETFLSLYRQVQELPILVLTGAADETLGTQTVHHGAQENLIKEELDARTLARAIRYAIERKRAEAQIRHSLREKEVLLREVHHRVKNNLQVISSLLRLGAARVQDTVAREVFRDSQDRIRSMAMIHETLYRSSDMARIAVAAYLQGLVRELFTAHNAYARGIQPDLRVAELELTIDTAIPCGLIVNELVTNSLEHAFPEACKTTADGAPRRIGVLFRKEGAGLLWLRVEDNGVGLPPTGDRPGGKPSLGLELVATLASQLRGRMEHVGQPASVCTIVFPERRGR